ncbi:TRAP transporter substrate-binding protein [Paralimibaculum aggregatum]|uniref:TRAP transporter substrate-binding protein n=1 Tax=Paralimibaculum aggregatum TaxID=3036245 RepID=A0ABQ6LNE9_9RHOB|nr:TRAP transporter substrate-binding protein [Limibaculum sp. NKW23]GMG82154.1 TRAP transporter substrate-binding protein [Limibaculum sp. NKW23]
MKPLTLLAATATALGLAGAAPAADVTLTVHHFLGPKSPAHTRLIEPWAERVEAQSGGRIAVEIFPSMAMGGKPPELYRQVRDGFADIVWTLPGYTPNVFPRSEVFELPTVHLGSATATNLAIQDVWEMIAPDFADVHPLLVHVHAGNALHLRTQKVGGVADVKGLKLRTPSRTGAWMIEAWGAEPVGMPVPALPQALSKGTVDGALVPFEIFPPLKLHEITAYSVEGADGSRFGAAVFLLAMNKERYESLPDDLKAVIDANSNAAIAAEMGAVWDAVEAPGKAMQRDSGGEIVELDPAAKAEFDALGAEIVARWIAETADKGFDGQALVEAARAAVAARSE